MKRQTIQKTLVLEMIKKLKGHRSADEIYDALVLDHPTISRATVYRQLNSLVEDKEISKVSMCGKADLFDHLNNKHYHCQCNVCNTIYDVEFEYLNNLEEKIKNKNDFEFDSHEIMFRGICPKCKK